MPPLRVWNSAVALHSHHRGETEVSMSGSQAHIIVFANEKGGTGKSTTAVHTGVALSAMGH